MCVAAAHARAFLEREVGAQEVIIMQRDDHRDTRAGQPRQQAQRVVLDVVEMDRKARPHRVEHPPTQAWWFAGTSAAGLAILAPNRP